MTQERFHDVLLAAWREGCRHIELGESLPSMARMLAPHLPLAALGIRELDPRRGALQTVAAAPATGPIAPGGRTQAAPADFKKWLAWCRRGEVAHRRPRAARAPEWAAMIPGPEDRSALLGPLLDRDGPVGVAVVVARAGAAFEPGHAAMFKALLEPFTAALLNDRRLRELHALRESAEADRESLLARLGRRGEGDRIVGAGTGLRLVMERVAEVAGTDVPVLILGEPGSGKEVIARAVHAASRRAGAPFLRVNCGTLPPDQAEVELFGGEGHHGWMRRAAGGTLLLDEIDALPLPAQARLLRVVSRSRAAAGAGEGGEDEQDVRVIAASDQDLSSRVREGRFRQDLWYAIAAFPILLPPLRERPEDIPALARHFAQRAAIRFGLPHRAPSPEDLALLMAYPWPGNVRELAAVIDRAALLSRGDRLEIAAALGQVPAPAPAGAGDGAGARGAGGTLASLDEAIRQHIEAALALTEGRIEGPHGAAHLLKINPHTLRARMRKLRIDWSRFRPRA